MAEEQKAKLKQEEEDTMKLIKEIKQLVAETKKDYLKACGEIPTLSELQKKQV